MRFTKGFKVSALIFFNFLSYFVLLPPGLWIPIPLPALTVPVPDTAVHLHSQLALGFLAS